MSTEDTNAARRWSGSNDLLGLVERLRAPSMTDTTATHIDRMRMAADEIERLRRALREIAEEWAGAECGEPVHAQEAYAIGLAKRMYSLAAEGLTHNAKLTGQGGAHGARRRHNATRRRRPG